MSIFIGAMALIFSGLVALYTYKVSRYTEELARCTREYTMETRRLWEVTKKSYFVGAAAGYLFEKYYSHIEEWPSDESIWATWLKWPPTEEQKPQIFKSDCDRVILEELFPDIREIEEEAVKKLGKKGYKFS